jgi:hypothetical protein
MIDRRIDDNLLKCPFCSRLLSAPGEIKTRFGSSYEGGKCECGSVFVYDRCGHTLGDAYVDALGLLCDDDWEKAWSLVPDQDYEVVELAYDSRRRRLGSEPRRRSNSPVFLFLRLKVPAS